MTGYIYLFLAVICTSLGQLTFKMFKNSQLKKYLALTIALFLVTPVFSFMALKYISLDVVYMFTSLSIVLILFFSHWILKEKITLAQIFGTVVIIVGIVLYNS